MRKTAFAPIVDANSKILLLGTMPGEESLRKQEYYGHKSNLFWKILFTLYNKPLADNYEERVDFLLENGIALWDVLQSCECIGSMDSNIKNEQPNDFQKFYKKHPHIKQIFFTSQKAKQFYSKYVGLDKEHTFSVLPSPSPANAKMRLSEKIETWKEILESVLSL